MVRASTLALVLALAAGIAVDAGKIYWFDSQSLRRSNTNGTDPETVVSVGGLPWLMQIDTAGGKIYWAEGGAGMIRRASLDGSDIENIVTGLDNPSTVALDLVRAKLYFESSSPRRILRSDLDGSMVEDVLLTEASVLDLALDPDGEKVYWVLNNEKIRRANLDGTGVEDLIVSGLDSPRAIALDLENGKMYWTEQGRIRRADLDGSSVEDLVSTPGPFAIALDVPHDKLYWSTGSLDGILRAGLDGSNPVLIAAASTPRGVGIAVFGRCGDGVLDPFEECDDGNDVGGDGCQTECLLPECGDGFLDAGEACDDGNLISCDGCSASCAQEPGFACGDGILNEDCGEQCDDGNNKDADGCQGDCRNPVCGDGIQDPGEECDDGDDLDGDECESDCTLPAAAILYDQTDSGSGESVFDQQVDPIYSAYDSEGADDFIITSPGGWDVESLLTIGTQSWENAEVLAVNIRFLPDLGGVPPEGFPILCNYEGLTDFDQGDGDLVIRLPSACKLPPGHWWMSHQVRMDLFSNNGGLHYWNTRSVRSGYESVWRNPGGAFGSGCFEWTPLSLCLGEDPDFLFQLRGTQGEEPDPVPAVGPLGLLSMLLAIGGSYVWISRRSRPRTS